MRNVFATVRRCVIPLAIAALGAGTLSTAFPAVAAAQTGAAARLTVTVPRSQYGTLHTLGVVSSAAAALHGPALAAAASSGPSAIPFLSPHPGALAGARPTRKSVVPVYSPAPHRAALTPAATGPLLTGFAGGSHDGAISRWCPTSPCSDLSQSVTPPDDNVAVSSNQVAEVVNSSMWVSDRSGNALAAYDLNTLFYPCVGSGPPTTTSDPRITYDPQAGRWYLSGTQWDLANTTAWSCVVIGVSHTSDLTTTQWTFYAIDWSGSPNGRLNDQPKLGFSNDKLVVSWNDFSGGGNIFLGQETWVIQKSDPYYLTQNTSSPTLGLIDISGTPAAGNVRYTEYDPSMPATTAPYSVAQPGTQIPLQADDDRLLDAAWMNGMLWTTANDACGNSSSCARFMEASTAAGSVQILPGQDWDLGGNATDYYYPSVTFDGAGDMVGAVNVSTPTTYASVAGLAEAAGYDGGPNFVDSAQTGTVPYTPTCQGCVNGNYGARWGDYAGAAYDPADPHGAWVSGEYTIPNNTNVCPVSSCGNDNWSTWIQDVEASGSQSGVAAPGGGYTLDGCGGVHPFGDSPAVNVTAYWPGWQIARTLALNPCDSTGQLSGWVMDGFGGLHPFAAAGTPTPSVPYTSGYWPGWGIANDFVAFCDPTTHQPEGCTLDGFGGLHAWADTQADAAKVGCTGTGYWTGWDVAIRISAIPGPEQGYVMVGYGGLHPFEAGGASMPSNTANAAYWPNWPIARDLVATANGGYTLDGFGGIPAFGSAPAMGGTGYWPNWDIVRGIDIASSGSGGYTLDAFGMVHPAGGAPFLSVTGYWPGSNLVCDFVTAP